MENNNPQAEVQAQSAPHQKKGNPKFAIIFGLLIVVGGIYGYIKYKHSLVHEDTEDAQVSSEISPVIPRVSGYIKEIRVKENQTVHKGDTLIVLDDRDFAVKVEAAEAALAAAHSNVSVAQAGQAVTLSNVTSTETGINTVDAQIAAAKVNLWRAEKDYQRYANLYQDHTITAQQYEQALAAKQSAEKQLGVLNAQKAAVTKQVGAVSSQKQVNQGQVAVANAAIKERQADLDAAKLNWSYTVIVAAQDGQVGKINLQVGQFINAGQSLFSVLPVDSKWVVANFKETQLNKMLVGQKAELKIDAFPDHVFEGRVSSFSPATGAATSLLPPDNATGNFVKVVQRVPVRIDFANPKDSLLQKVRVGMNVEVDVHLK